MVARPILSQCHQEYSKALPILRHAVELNLMTGVTGGSCNAHEIKGEVNESQEACKERCERSHFN